MNQNQQNKIQFNCNVCFSQPGMYLTVCTCIYCKDCLKELDFNKTECKVCKKNFDIKKTLDMSRPEQVRNIEFIFDNFENQLKRTLECYKVVLIKISSKTIRIKSTSNFLKKVKIEISWKNRHYIIKLKL